jgi:hypothetical protein
VTGTVARQLAEITYDTGYRGLIVALRDRVAERQIALSGEAVAEVAGLPRGYLQKILSPLPKSREDVRRIGVASLGPVLGVLGVKLVMVEDAEALERFGSRIPKRDPRAVRSGTLEFSISRRFLKQIQRQGGLARWQNKTPAQRAAWARRMNRLRWHRAKATRHEQPTQDTAAGA